MFPCHWLILSAYLTVLVNGGQVQVANLQLPSDAPTHKQDVVNLFTQSYQAYRQYAWGHDDLLPVSKSYADVLNGWGATIVDALDTMWIMNLTTWFDEAVNYTASVDFSVPRKKGSTVNIFETTIRFLGGLLSAYELSGYQYDVLYQKAEQIAQHLTYAWVGDNVIPYTNINFADHTPSYEPAGIAGVGTLTLEWNRLSLYTKNDTYRQLAENAVKHILNSEPKPLVGMPAMYIDPSNGKSIGSFVSWGAGSDSFYEYLIKYARLTNDNSYADAWSTAADTSIEKLLKTSTVGNWSYLAEYDGQVLHVGSHLACFYGGNWILGGRLTNNDTIFNIGLQLTDACWNTYASTATGIGPETFAYISSDGSYTGGRAPTTDQIQFYNEHGYYITRSDYILRPEVLESNFYAWRATGNTKYLNNAVSAIQSFKQYLPATVAYSGINNVNNVNSAKINDMESFWFAEVLKYLYLTFDDPNHISLDDYVFNTECHPFKAPTAQSVYGSGPPLCGTDRSVFCVPVQA